MQRRGHTAVGRHRQEQGRKDTAHTEPFRPDLLFPPCPHRQARHGGRTLCPRLGRNADGTRGEHRVQLPDEARRQGTWQGTKDIQPQSSQEYRHTEAFPLDEEAERILVQERLRACEPR